MEKTYYIIKNCAHGVSCVACTFEYQTWQHQRKIYLKNKHLCFKTLLFEYFGIKVYTYNNIKSYINFELGQD